MHLIVLVSELKNGQRVVTLNNKRVFISTARGLEPGSERWLRSTPSEGSKVRGCAFNCGKAEKAPEQALDF